MTLHKLTAGDGYTYLTRQVAAHDATTRGFGSLGDYYSEKGEAPGVWIGRGLAGVPEFPVGERVTETQMDRASRLGAPYRVFDQSNEFRRRCAEAFRDQNIARGLEAVTPVPEEE